MNALPTKCLVDTNIPKIANLALEPDSIPDDLTCCVVSCIEAIEHVVKKGGLVMDSGNILAQNRGSYLHLPVSGQWKKLADWLAPRTDALFEQLTDRYILFGEWCYAQHSVNYDQLPDWFLGFDIYDKGEGQFFSCARRNDVFRAMGVASVPKLEYGHFMLSELCELLSQSQFSERPAEGLYLRHDQGNWLLERTKLVRPAFIQSVEEHWSRSGIKANRLRLFKDAKRNYDLHGVIGFESSSRGDIK